MNDQRVFLVSYPRSGQHYVQRLLERVTGDDNYCELYKCVDVECPARGKPVHEKSPCPSGRRFQKSHDFDLHLPISSDSLYVVLWRRPLLSIASYYEREFRNRSQIRIGTQDGTEGCLMSDTRDAWVSFTRERAIYWSRFVEKWSTAAGKENVLFLRYEDITSDIRSTKRLFDFCFKSHDQDKLQELMAAQNLALANGRAPNRDLQNFRHPIEQATEVARSVITPSVMRSAGYDDVI
ncbi:sulfotransferase domain-containing protein [Parvularcula sp. LCG005]|uniref:sulfotransferase domain-containing protein n=1 Tax=Parvularcula sp. LCG005 TaxID=3078805 RepID=UPI0039792803